MKAILMSIRPEWVAKILNGEKTIEIRKKFPSDYVGWVYIYCTKGKEQLFICKDHRGITATLSKKDKNTFFQLMSNGKVVARFWCDKVETIQCNWHYEAGNCYNPETFYEHDLLEKSCLAYNELNEYLNGKNGKAIHITKLEIFDKPKEIKEFYKVGCEEYFTKHVFVDHPNFRPIYERELKQFQLTRAPESWQYIEV